MPLRSPNIREWSRRSRRIASVDDYFPYDLLKSHTTRRGSCAVTDDARSYARCRLKTVVCDVVFSALACFPASKDGGHACGLPANDAGPAADECVRHRSVDIVWTKHASHEVNVVHHPTGATDIAGYCEVDRGRDMLDAPKPSVPPKRRRTSAIVRRRRSGFTNFPSWLPSKSPCREPARPPSSSTEHSRSAAS